MYNFVQNYFQKNVHFYIDINKDEYISNLERALDEIFDDYCDENNLEWVEED